MTFSAEWHKSSYSSGNNECVETREHVAGADIRDTRNRDAGHLTFPSSEWVATLAAEK
ncbi:DUF397 domain-containing protein [Nocardiopsis changdeensis]|uniref:DUF397 domain-containing protein n=1 Tax=Nocardiopsis changdeensis TaxID=2831969 RepID=A0ABX8BLY0_9ACTN|nr:MULTISPECIES: DUF397 domain-containing protein [Nocardiopsis]QUX23240.1 DUF397 domain-containing protein [Nocardiopsis changdeensis]QYX39182.1 DUF397 domain-containing protein [Nocardiopsis sp. MT53]